MWAHFSKQLFFNSSCVVNMSLTFKSCECCDEQRGNNSPQKLSDAMFWNNILWNRYIIFTPSEIGEEFKTPLVLHYVSM